VSFKIEKSDAIKDKFIESAPMYKDTKGLIRKNYLVNNDTNTVGGVYIFDNADLERVQKAWGVIYSKACEGASAGEF